jgi:hypothetical protein
LESLAADDKGKPVRAKWNAVKLTSEGAEASTGIRLGGTLMLIEMFCFGAALAKADKTDEDHAMLLPVAYRPHPRVCNQRRRRWQRWQRMLHGRLPI